MKPYLIREAKIEDIPDMQVVRASVRENILTKPHLITYENYVEFLTIRGKGWVCEIDGKIQGFAVADLQESNIWALFLHPNYEKKGIGTQLQYQMLDWYFEQGKEKVWLSTDNQSRAETFYRKSGWKEVEYLPKNEVKFEMTLQEWKEVRQSR